MFENIKGIIFDMDGTLIDSMWLWRDVDINYLKKHGLELPHNLQKDIEGKSFSETANYFKERFGITDDVETIKSDWNQMAGELYKSKVTLKPYVLEFIHACKQLNIKLGVGTSNSKELLEVIIERFKLNEYFDSIRTSCEVEKGKPDPAIFLKVCEDLGLEPEQCIVFEDIPNGILAANNAGMYSIAIHDDFSKHMEEEKRELADYYIDSFEEILEVLKKEMA